MNINKELLEKVAENARLELTEEEKEEFLPQLKEILTFFETLSEFNEDEKPSFHPIPLADALREDKLKECLSVEEALSCTSNKKNSYFKGPKAI